MKHIYDYTDEYAKINPEKIALSDENGFVTYAELVRKSKALAAKLSSIGVQTGESVAVYVPYVKEIVIGTFAAIRCGGVYVPMDINYPKDRLDFILEDSKAVALLTLRHAWEEKPLDYPADKVIFMDDEFESAEYTSPYVSMDSPAFILYTSGTTGRPKGVVLPHMNFVTLMDFASVNEGTQITEDTRAGIISGLTFSGTTLILYSPLMYGGTSILAPLAVRTDLDLLYEFLRKEKITHVFMGSSLAATMVEHFDCSGINIFAGGEKLRHFNPISKDTGIINTYGCTEMGGMLSTIVHGNEDMIPNGFVAPDSTALIVDEELNPVKEGETGEFIISNNRMARVYLGLPEQTKEKWVELDNRIWYRTGDRAKRSKEGIYYVLGRSDNMVKVHGFRIETGEVEAQIGKAAAKINSDVNNIAVVARCVNGIDHLVCYYECCTELDEEIIVNEISKTLASYMVPDIFVRMEAMPRNANGKVMRDKLPQPESRASAPGIIYNEVEARVVEAVAYVLRLKQYISPEDGFAQLGGTSLQAMELANELRNLGIYIGSAEILKHNVIRDIAAKAEVSYERLWSDEEYAKVKADFASRGEIIKKVKPITPAQDDLLFESIIHPDEVGLRRVFMLQTDSLIDESELREAFDYACSNCEDLHSAIVFHDVTVFQQVITNRKIPIQMIDVEAEDFSKLYSVYRALKARPADLQNMSLVQVVYARMGKESMIFVLDHLAKNNMAFTRKYLFDVMSVLEEKHPRDESIKGWKELFEIGILNDRQKSSEKDGSQIIQHAKNCPKMVDDIYVYSKEPKTKMVFVHTGNTGSEAYFNFAERIKKDFAFSVIEPYNLYHPDKAKYGIKNIAKKYIEILKEHQPQGPYILGGWCYGGIVAHEMACQLQASGEKVEMLIMLDSHVVTDEETRKAAEDMHSGVSREYFESEDLFEGMRQSGMLEALIQNSGHVSYDMMTNVPSFYSGKCLYFKPEVIPQNAGAGKKYWEKMMTEFDAGGFENFISRENLEVVKTPHEHDCMMDSESLDIIVPQIYRACGYLL